MTLEQTKPITIEAFWEISHRPEYADKSLELVKGLIVEMSRPGREHGVYAALIASLIVPFVLEHNLGEVTVESGYILFTSLDGKDTVRGPDVAFISKERLPANIIGPYTPVAPDLAVEVVSPNDTMEEIETKVEEYLEAGTRLVWVFFPHPKTVIVYTPNGTSALDMNGTLDGGDVLPGFRLPVAAIFPKKKETA